MAQKYKASLINLKKANRKLCKQKHRLKNKINKMKELATAATKTKCDLVELAISSIKLMLDEMSIKIETEWDEKQHVGFVKLGANIDDDSLTAATNAMVFLLVPISSNWKIPIAYYLTAGLKGKILTNLTRNILTHLHNNDIQVCVLVCDGCGANQIMLSELGVHLEYPLKSSSFPYPADPFKHVYVILDNMFKLIRNMLAQYVSIKTVNTGNIISWNYISRSCMNYNKMKD